MDSLVSAAARALRAGDPLGALKRVALREDAPALALRGIAMAQLGELAKAKPLLRRAARAALERARHAAERANIPSLSAEVEQAMGLLAIPAARLIARGEERSILLEEVEAVLASKNLVVDACRRAARSGRQVIALARRPVLFALLRALAEAWPGETARELLIWRAFGARRGNASHRARLRVELGRLRKALRGLGEVRATPHGFLLAPRRPDEEVLVLAPPIGGADADVLPLP